MCSRLDCACPVVRGHDIEGVTHTFPHVCPGEDCAVAAWIRSRHFRAPDLPAEATRPP